jgi:N-methylhydantoinase A
VPPARRVWFPDDGWRETPVIDRASLSAQPRPGPLIIQEYDATCLVPRAWAASLDAFGNIRLTAG